MFPYIDLVGFKGRAKVQPADVDWVENKWPGFTTQALAQNASWVNARLRKRYGNSLRGLSALPFGQTAPALLGAGTSPPALQLTGRPTLGSLLIGISVVTPGVLGAAVLKWTTNGGSLSTTITPSGGFALDHGVSVVVPVGAVFAVDNQYAAATPVPEIVLKWLVAITSLDVMQRRGFNPQDPSGEMYVKAYDDAKKEVLEAADSKDGLFDLPTSEDEDSAVTTGGPLGYSDASPYAWQFRQAGRGGAQDRAQYQSGITGSGYSYFSGVNLFGSAWCGNGIWGNGP